jgi:hypothetical protein
MKTSVTIVSVPGQIQTGHLMNVSRKRCLHTNRSGVRNVNPFSGKESNVDAVRY